MGKYDDILDPASSGGAAVATQPALKPSKYADIIDSEPVAQGVPTPAPTTGPAIPDTVQPQEADLWSERAMKLPTSPQASNLPPPVATPPISVPAPEPSIAESHPGVKSFLTQLKDAWSRGDKEVLADIMDSQAMRGKRDPNEVAAYRKQLADLERTDPIAAESFMKQSAIGVARMIPGMVRGLQEGFGAGTGAAVGAAVAGQMGPQVATPEEIVTVPGAFVAGEAMGSAKFWMDQGSGAIYRDLLNAGVSKETAAKLAPVGGAPYALIEYSQVDKIIPGLGRMAKTFAKKSLLNGLLRITGRAALNVAHETGEEVVQQVVTDATETTAKYLDGVIKGSDLPAEAKRAAENAITTAKQTVGPMALLQLPGSAVASGAAVAETRQGVQTPPAAPAPATAPEKPPAPKPAAPAAVVADLDKNTAKWEEAGAPAGLARELAKAEVTGDQNRFNTLVDQFKRSQELKAERQTKGEELAAQGINVAAPTPDDMTISDEPLLGENAPDTRTELNKLKAGGMSHDAAVAKLRGEKDAARKRINDQLQLGDRVVVEKEETVLDKDGNAVMENGKLKRQKVLQVWEIESENGRRVMTDVSKWESPNPPNQSDGSKGLEVDSGIPGHGRLLGGKIVRGAKNTSKAKDAIAQQFGSPKPAESAPISPEAKSGSKPVELMTPDEWAADFERTTGTPVDRESSQWKGGRVNHASQVKDALAAHKPVSAAAVDKYSKAPTSPEWRVTLPAGYVREGDQYVYKGEPAQKGKKAWEIAEENVGPYAESLRLLSDKDLGSEDRKISDAINKWAKDTPSFLPDGTLNPKLSRDQAYFDLSAKLSAIGREQNRRKAGPVVAPKAEAIKAKVKAKQEAADAGTQTIRESRPEGKAQVDTSAGAVQGDGGRDAEAQAPAGTVAPKAAAIKARVAAEREAGIQRAEPSAPDAEDVQAESGRAEDRRVEADLAAGKTVPVEVLSDLYERRFGNVLNTDNAKLLFKNHGYDPKDAQSTRDFHPKAVAIVNRLFDHWIEAKKSAGDGSVVFMGGGNASGKSTAAKDYARDVSFVFDSTMASEGPIREKIKQAADAGYPVALSFVYRNPVDAWFNGIYDRTGKGEHTTPDTVFAKNHANTRKTFIKLIEEFGASVNYKIVESVFGKPFRDITLDELRAKPDRTAAEILEAIHEGHERAAEEKSGRGAQAGDSDISQGSSRGAGEASVESPAAEEEVIPSSVLPAPKTDRERLAQRIAEASRRPMPELVSRKDEKGETYWVIQNRDGTTGGVRQPTERALRESLQAVEDRNVQKFYKQLVEMSDADLARQENYYLKEVPQNQAVNAVSTKSIVDFLNAAMKGEKTAKEVQDHLRWMLDNEAVIKAHIRKQVDNHPKLKRKREKTKGAAVERQFDKYLDYHAYLASDGLSWMPGQETKRQAVERAVSELTDEKLKAAAAKRATESAAHKKALENPETLSEYDTFVAYRGDAALSPEQRTQWDALRAEAGMSRREEASIEKRAVVGAVEGAADTPMEIVERMHSKRGTTVFIVTMGNRVDSATFKELAQKARALGGNYARAWKPTDSPAGFMFNEREKAEQFMGLREKAVDRTAEVMAAKEETKEAAADRLTEMADRMESAAEDKMNQDRKVNTSRRADMADRAIAQASNDIAMAKTIRNIAEAVRSGKAKFLKAIRTRTQMETLESILNRTRTYTGEERGPADPAKAQYPEPKIHNGNIPSVAEELSKVKGGKLAAIRLRKYFTPGVEEMRAIDRDLAQKIVDVAPRQAGWYVEDQLQAIKRLEAMNITNDAELRSALREYMEFKGIAPKEDPVTKLRRGLAGTKIAGWFPTPPPLVADMLDKANIRSGDTVLEPSAGDAQMADAIRARHPDSPLSVVEINGTMREIIEAAGHNLVASDFLEHGGQYDRIVMNPPFENGQDIDHVKHAYDLLNPGGRVVAIMSEGPFYRSDKKAEAFREWLDEVGGTSEQNPAGSFDDPSMQRTTGVATRTVVIDKPVTKAEQPAARSPEPSVNSDLEQPPARTESIAKAEVPADAAAMQHRLNLIENVYRRRYGDEMFDLIANESKDLTNEQWLDLAHHVLHAEPIGEEATVPPETEDEAAKLVGRYIDQIAERQAELDARKEIFQSTDKKRSAADDAAFKYLADHLPDGMSEVLERVGRDVREPLGRTADYDDVYVINPSIANYSVLVAIKDEQLENGDWQTWFEEVDVDDVKWASDEGEHLGKRQYSKILPVNPDDNVVTQPAPEPESVAKSKPMNMAGETRPEKPAKFVTPFSALPHHSQDVFHTAFGEKNETLMREMVEPRNATWRKEFEDRTGIKLPKTIGGTHEAVHRWAKGGEAISEEDMLVWSGATPAVGEAKLAVTEANKREKELRVNYDLATRTLREYASEHNLLTTKRTTVDYYTHDKGSVKKSAPAAKREEYHRLEKIAREAIARLETFIREVQEPAKKTLERANLITLLKDETQPRYARLAARLELAYADQVEDTKALEDALTEAVKPVMRTVYPDATEAEIDKLAKFGFTEALFRAREGRAVTVEDLRQRGVLDSEMKLSNWRKGQITAALTEAGLRAQHKYSGGWEIQAASLSGANASEMIKLADALHEGFETVTSIVMDDPDLSAAAVDLYVKKQLPDALKAAREKIEADVAKQKAEEAKAAEEQAKLDAMPVEEAPVGDSFKPATPGRKPGTTEAMIKAAKSRNATLPVLSTIHVKDGKARVTDLELEVEIPMDLPDGLYTAAGKTWIKSNIEMDEFPPAMALGDKPATIKLTAEQSLAFKKAMLQAAPAMSSDDTRYILNGVLIDASAKTGEITIVATDGRRLHTSKVGGVDIQNDVQGIIPWNTVEAMRKSNGAGPITLKLDPSPASGNVEITDGNSIIRSKLIEGTYPNYRQVIPDPGGQKMEMIVDRKALGQAVADVMPFLKADPDVPEVSSVNITFSKDGVTVTAANGRKNYHRKRTVPVVKMNKGYELKPIVVSLDVDYMLDLMKANDSQNVIIGLEDGLSPITVKDPTYTHVGVAMPMRLKAQGERSGIKQSMTRDEFEDYIGSLPLRDTWGELDVNDIKQIAGAAEQWKLISVDVNTLEPTTEQATDKWPIIVAYGDVLDGRRRRMAALNKGQKAILAWVGSDEGNYSIDDFGQQIANLKTQIAKADFDAVLAEVTDVVPFAGENVGASLYADAPVWFQEDEGQAARATPSWKQGPFDGEFWLQNGKAKPASGEGDEANHEAVVMQAAAKDVADALREAGSEDLAAIIEENAGDPTGTRTAINDWTDSQEDADELNNMGHVEMIQKRLGEFTVSEDLIKSLVEGTDFDARVVGMKEYGWVRVAGRTIQTHQATHDGLRSIARGLRDAYGDEVDTGTFDIEVSGDATIRNPRAFYTDVPFEVIASGDVSALRAYKDKPRHMLSRNGDIRAVTVGKRSWFFLDRYDNLSQLRADIREEAAHRLINELGGEAWPDIGRQTYRGEWDAIAREIEQNYGYERGTPEFNHELIAKAFRDGKNKRGVLGRFMDAVVAWFRKMLRRLGQTVSLSDAEVRNFLRSLLEAKAQRTEATRGMVQEQAMFARGERIPTGREAELMQKMLETQALINKATGTTQAIERQAGEEKAKKKVQRKVDEIKARQKARLAAAQAEAGVKRKANPITSAGIEREFQRIGQIKGRIMALAQASRKADNIANIKKELATMVREQLPVVERGRFVAMVASAKTNKNFMRVALRVHEAVEEWQKRTLVGDIKTTIRDMNKDAREGKGVAIEYVKRINDLLEDYDITKPTEATLDRLKALRDFVTRERRDGNDIEVPGRILAGLDRLTKTPLAEIDLATLIELDANIKKLMTIGEAKLRARKAAQEAAIQADLRDLKAQGANPLASAMLELEMARAEAESLKLRGEAIPKELQDKIAEMGSAIDRREPGKTKSESAGRMAEVRRRYYDMRDAVRIADLRLNPMDVIFDILDGVKGYTGVLFRTFKTRIDNAFSFFLNEEDRILDQMKAKIKEHGITWRESERIGVYAIDRQKSGREKLINAGLSDETIDQITNSMTENELAFYRWMRSTLDSMFPAIKETMRVHYNMDVESVADYFPFLTDWLMTQKEADRGEAWDSFLVSDQMSRQYTPPKRHVEKGYTISRVGAGKQAVRVDSVQVFQRHIKDALYLVHVGPHIVHLGRTAGRQEFRTAVGDYGAKVVQDWIDTLARKGGVPGEPSRMLDAARRNMGAATLGFKVVTALIQTTPILHGMSAVGPVNATMGLNSVLTSKAWRAWLAKEMPEIRHREGDDPAYLEYGADGWMQAIRQAGYVPLKTVDLIAASSIAAGSYTKSIDEAGLSIRNGDPAQVYDPDGKKTQDQIDEVMRKAILKAELIVRRTQASAQFKDAPPIVTRGRFKNPSATSRSWYRVILQFQNYALNLLSYLRHEGMRKMPESEAFKRSMVWAFWIASVMGTEAIRSGYDALVSSLFGQGGDDDERREERPYLLRVGQEMVSNIPFVSSIVGSARYGGIPVPLADIAAKGWEGAVAVATGKKPETKIRGSLKVADSATRVFVGFPGAAEIMGLIRRSGALDTPVDEKRDIIRDTLRDLPDDPPYFRLNQALNDAFAAATDAGVVATEDEEGNPLGLAEQKARFTQSFYAQVEKKYGEEFKKGYANWRQSR